MANYTTDEVQAAVSKIVRSTVRHPTGVLGERQVETSFNDLQEAAVGVYILYFNAPYYTLLLGVSRLKDALSTQASTIASLIDAVLATKRSVTPVSDLTPLANARAALDSLQAAVGARSQGFNDIQAVPAFRQYAANIDQFLAINGPNIKGSGNTPSANPSTTSTGSPASVIVDTPAGAQSQIPGLVTLLKSQQDDIVRRVKLLSGALADFGSLNLPQLAAQNVIANARTVLDQHYQDLAAVDENTRLENLRAVVLDLITQRPLVETYGAGLDPSQFVPTQGLAKAYSDANHLANAASLLSTKPGPYNIVDTSHLLRVTVDGGTPIDYPLPLGFVAELDGILVEPFKITTDSNALSIAFGDPNGVMARRDIALTTGAARTAAQVAAQLNAGLTGLELVVETYFRPKKLDTQMLIATTGGHNARFTVLAGGLNGLNLLVGDQVDVLDGPNASTTWTITSIDPSGLFMDTAGSITAVNVALPGSSVQAGPAARALRIRDTNPAVSLAQRRAIQLPLTGGVSDTPGALLGFFPGTSARSTPVLATDIAANVTGSTSVFNAKAVDVTEYTGVGHGSLADGTLVVISEYLGSGTITGGTTVTYTFDPAHPPTVDISTLNNCIIRSSETPADVGAVGVVQTETDTTFTIVFASPITAGTVTLEVGPDLSFNYGDVLTITDGPNQGRYTAREPQGVGTSCSFEVTLDRTLPVPKTGSTVTSFGLTFGQSFVAFASPTQSITSSITIDSGSVGAGDYFFESTALPVTGTGQSVYLQFDTYPKGAAVADLVQLFENQYNIISREFSIVGVEPSLRVLKLDAAVESSFSMTFDQGVPNPFGAIRISQTANYGDFKKLLDTWLLQPELTTEYYRDLARFLNPVLTNQNPTSAAVDDAAHQLEKLYAITSIAGATAYGTLHSPAVTASNTLEFALNDYTSPVEPSVTALIATFRNKGADRAIDLLLEGQFSTFFGLNLDTVSYSGALSQASRDLAMNDLPIRKTDRRDSRGQQLIGTIPNEPNFEFDTSDADSPDTPDIPGAPDVATPGENF